MKAVRTFIAVLIEEELKRRLANIQDEVKIQTGAIRWVAPDNLHVTIKFLGNVPAERLTNVFEAVEHAARKVESFRLSLGRVGGFPNLSRPRVVWVGVEAGEEELGRLAEAVEACLASVGFQREEKPFRAHITIGRLREGQRAPDLSELRAQNKPAVSADQQVHAVAVMGSDLTPAGPVYSVLKSVRLGRNNSDTQ